jgi:predicted acylesterase/phospholipase RssA
MRPSCSKIPEVFPSKTFNGTRYVDGGIADNIPILGLAESAPDRMIVIYLDHRFRRVKNLARWQTDRLLKIQKSRAGYEQGDEARITWARRVLPAAISFIPSKNVGNVLTGTLNFSPHKARWLMQLGYQDALDTLRKVAR